MKAPEVYLNKNQEQFLNLININYRLNEEDMSKERKTGGMNFFGNVSIYGDAINIEGNQYNLSSEDKNEVLKTLVALLKSNTSNKEIIETIGVLHDRNKAIIEPSEIKDIIAVEMKDEVNKPKKKNKLKKLLDDMSGIVSSGNSLISGIVAGFKLLGL